MFNITYYMNQSWPSKDKSIVNSYLDFYNDIIYSHIVSPYIILFIIIFGGFLPTMNPLPFRGIVDK